MRQPHSAESPTSSPPSPVASAATPDPTTIGYGPWHAPSGKLDRGETLRSAAARELYEETEYPAAGLYGYLDGGRVLTEHGFSGGRGGRGALGGVRPCASPPAVG
ncbi:NUDIX domain-containing protein [Streptomyces sp. NPDC056672]|uniref:NUDIX domain-containing protein n=1 Tax=Streptomyces sp. NPDC056672 TaxID=3345906 RepID=UPI00369FE2EC